MTNLVSCPRLLDVFYVFGRAPAAGRRARLTVLFYMHSSVKARRCNITRNHQHFLHPFLLAVLGGAECSQKSAFFFVHLQNHF